MRNGSTKLITALAAEVDEDQRGESERREIREQDARDQVHRREQAAHDDREQDGDQHRDHGDDVPEIGRGQLIHVVGERLDAETPCATVCTSAPVRSASVRSAGTALIGGAAPPCSTPMY